MLIGSQPHMEVCGFAASEQEALEQIQKTQPDLAVVDLGLRDSHGLELIKQLAIHRPTLKTLVISAYDEDVYAQRCLDAGARGYINKQEATEKLTEGIRTVIEGQLYFSQKTANRILKHRIRHPAAQNAENAPSELLSNRELEVFRLLGEGLTTRQIADKLRLSPKTVARYRENIKHKLNLASAAELLHRATQWVLEQG
jgi:DNA-binding NarL/FixJ family response regulator